MTDTAPLLELEPVVPAHYPFIYDMFTQPDQLRVGRLRGACPSPQDFDRFLWEGVLTQFVVSAQAQPLALVTAYGPNHRHGFVYISVHAIQEVRHSGIAILGLSKFIDYLFAVYPFRKIYAEMLRCNYAGAFEGLEHTYFEVEGTLRSHEYVDGEYMDLLVLALYREKWTELRTRRAEALSALGK